MSASTVIAYPQAVTDDTLFSEQSGQRMGRKNPVFSGKWNWGAFFFQWIWILNHGKFGQGLGFLLLSFIPVVNLGVAIYCGVKGNDIAYDGRRFSSVAQFVAVQNAWRNWGFAIIAISLLFSVIAEAAVNRVH